ncbi:MAG TPA: DoxX family membrane protein [Candidatus Saccharimonadales bacterium]|nr:DoxX family membrane protein [Candidatus Saccharimonadales bacterium]
MNVLKNVHNPRLAVWGLRLGLAFVFAYAGVDTLREPLAWSGYLPHFLTSGAQLGTVETMMRLFAVFELGLAAWLVAGVYLRYAALVAAGLLGGIVVFNPDTLIVTFRDVGLCLMAVALFFDA